VLVERTGCRLTGLDIEPEGVPHANSVAARRGLADCATFATVDCGGKLPFDDDTFDSVPCVDSIGHLPDRFGVLLDWGRLLRKGGRLVFIDPFVPTGGSRQERDR
jgi:SAM-dependent methyltransferase